MSTIALVHVVETELPAAVFHSKSKAPSEGCDWPSLDQSSGASRGRSGVTLFKIASSMLTM